MNAAVYPKSAKGAEHALRATGENRLDISDADENTLRKALDEQCDNHKIKGLKLKLIQTVFRQTIGYGKREDDLSGKCLQKLVGSRRDYSNKHTTALINQSILLSRKGFYGRILSINYNFDDWGKAPEDIETQHSEPEKILQNKQKENTANTHAPRENSDNTVPASPNANEQHEDFLKHILPDDITRLITQDMLNQLADTLMSGIKVILEQLTPQILQQLIPAEIVVKQDAKQDITPDTTPNIADEKPVEIIPQALEKAAEKPAEIIPQALEKAAEKPVEIIPQVLEKAAEKPAEIILQVLEKAPEKPVEIIPQALEKPAEIQAETPAEKEIQPAESPVQADHYDSLIFPAALKPYEQTQIKNILVKEQLKDLNGCQLILNSMASRFALDMPPIKSPIAYFRCLLKKHNAGEFEDSYAESFTQQRQEVKKQACNAEQQQQQQTQLAEYNKAKNCYENLKLYTKMTGRNMREVAKDRGWLELIERMGFDLGVA